MSTWHDENRWYARLMKLAHELAMEGRGEEAQDLRWKPTCWKPKATSKNWTARTIGCALRTASGCLGPNARANLTDTAR